ncbi:MAG: C40 family peptidase [Solirubrobacteraceae bacterium]
MLATAPALPAVKVHSAWVASARTTRVASLSLSGVPSAARVVLRCRGGGCPFTTRPVATGGAPRVSLTRALRHVRLRVGASVDVRVSEASSGTLLVRFIVRSGKAPAKQRSWLALQPAPPTPAPPAPVPPGGEPPAGPPAGQPGPSTGQRALDVAAGYVGTPFVWGGASPATGFDDAGLVQYAYAQVGVALPRVADDQFRVGTAVARGDLLPGDLVFFADPSGYVDHVGLYAGGGQFLHAPHAGAVVSYDALSTAYYAQRFAGGRRLG